MQSGNLFIQDLRENVDTNGATTLGAELGVFGSEFSIACLVQGNLGQDLVREGARHDERGVTRGTAQVDQTPIGQQNNVAAIRHQVAIHLWLDVLDGLGIGLEPGNVNLDVEVADVANNGIVAHDLEMTANDNVTATSGGDKDLTQRSDLIHGVNLEARHGSLESIDGIDLGDDDTSTHAAERLGTALANITEAGNHCDLAGDHDIGRTLNTVNQGLPATVVVIELGLGDRVIDVDGGHQQLALLQHAIEVMNTGGSLLGNTVAVLQHLGVLVVNQSSQVTTIVQDEVELLSILESSELLLQAPVVLLFRLTLPGETAWYVRHWPQNRET